MTKLLYISRCWNLYVSPGCNITLAFFWMFLPYFSMLILSVHHLGVGSKTISLSPEFCLHRTRQALISEFFVFSWFIVWENGINKCGWCRRQGMLTQEPTPDPKCKIISLIHTLPHLVDCLICVRNAMFIVLSLQKIGDG